MILFCGVERAFFSVQLLIRWFEKRLNAGKPWQTTSLMVLSAARWSKKATLCPCIHKWPLTERFGTVMVEDDLVFSLRRSDYSSLYANAAYSAADPWPLRFSAELFMDPCCLSVQWWRLICLILVGGISFRNIHGRVILLVCRDGNIVIHVIDMRSASLKRRIVVIGLRVGWLQL